MAPPNIWTPNSTTHRPGLRPYCTCCAWRQHPATHTADYNRAGALLLATYPLYLASQAPTAGGAAAKRSCIGTPSCAFRAVVAAIALRMHSQPLLKHNGGQGAAASAPKKKAKKAKPAAKKRTTTTRYPSPPTEHSPLELAWWRLLNAGMRLSGNPTPQRANHGLANQLARSCSPTRQIVLANSPDRVG